MGEKMNLTSDLKVHQLWGKVGVCGSKRDEKVAKTTLFYTESGTLFQMSRFDWFGDVGSRYD